MRATLNKFAALLSFGILGMADAAEPKPLALGDDAPVPVGISHEGKELSFGDLYKGGKTLVYFFPKAMTPG